MDVFSLSATISLNIDNFTTNLDKAQKKFKSFSDNISGLSGKIEGIYKDVGDVLKPAVDGFKAVEGVGKQAGNAVMGGLKGFAAASTAVAGFGTAAVKTGAEFDSSMSTVQALSGATGDELTALRNKAIEMGAKTKFSAKEAADAMTYMGMAGWKTEDMLGGISGIMSLAAASGEDLATTSDIVTDALTAFGMTAADSGRFADVLAVAATNANTDVGMMGETFKYVAPVAGTMGYSVEDAALAIGLMANSSIKGSMAGTALRSIITRLSTDAGASSKSLGALGTLTKKLGVEFYNTDGSARALNDVLMESRAVWQGLTAEQKANYAKVIAGQEAIAGWNAIMNASDEDVKKLTASIEDCNGAADKMSKIKLDNLAGDITYLQSAFGSLQIAISDSLTPTLREFAQFGQKAMADLLTGFQGNGVDGFMSALSKIVTDGVTMLADKAPEFASVSLKFIQSLAQGLIDASSKIFSSMDEVRRTLVSGLRSFLDKNSDELVGIGGGLLNQIMMGFRAGVRVISDYIGDFVPLIIRAITAYHKEFFTAGMEILGAIGRGIVDNKDLIQENMFQAVFEMVSAIKDNAPAIIEGGLSLLEALINGIVENAELIGETALDIVNHLAAGLGKMAPKIIPAAVELILGLSSGLTSPENIKNIIDAALKIIEGLVEGLTKALPKLIAYAPEIIVNLVTGIIAGIPKLVAIGVDLIKGLIEGLIQGVLALPEAIARVVGALVDGFKALLGIHSPSTVFAEIGMNLIAGLLQGIQETWQTILDFFSTAVEGVITFFQSAWDGIKEVFSGVAEFFGEVFTAAVEAISAAWSAVVEFFSGVWESIQGVFSTVAEVLGGLFQAAAEAVQAAWSAVVEFFAGVWQGIQEIFASAAEVLGGLFQAAAEAVKNAWSAMVEFFQGVWDGIKNVFSTVAEVLGKFFSDAVEAIKQAWEGISEFFKGVWEGIKEVFAEVAEVLGGFFQAAAEAVQAAWEGVVDFFAGVWENIKASVADVHEAIGNAFDEARKRVEKAFDNVESFFKGVISKIVGVFNGVKSKFATIGKNIVGGIKSGITEAWGALKATVGKLTDGLVKGVKGILGIKSPSKVFAEIGGYMAEGLGVGWENEFGGIKSKIESGLNFGTASIGLSGSYSGGRYGANGDAVSAANVQAGTTVNIYSPVAVDPVQAAREWKKTTQRMAIGYV